MTALKAIIVDDESSARNILRSLLQDFCPKVQVLDECTNIKGAVQSIRKHKPDVVFLDIEMPEYAGYEIVNFFDNVDFEIVFVTAYNQYALKAFEVAAIDYLVKPIDIDRLIEAVEKIEEKLESLDYKKQLQLLKETMTTKEVQRIAIMEKGYRSFIEVDNIIAIEAQRAYCNIYMKDGAVHCVTKNLKQFENMLTDNTFFRSHKSWIVNLNFMNSFSKSKAEIKLDLNIVAKLSKYKVAAFEAIALSA